jgi:hypothetical protein
MTKTFQKQLQDLLNQEGGIETVLSMYEGSGRTVINALYNTHDIIVPQWYHEEDAKTLGYEDKDHMYNTIQKNDYIFECINDMMQQCAEC